MTNEELWQTVLGEIELSLSKASFTTWFKNTAIQEIDDNKVIIVVPNIFAKEWLEKKYKKLILDSIQKHFPKVVSFGCIVGTAQVVPEKELETNKNPHHLKRKVSKKPLYKIQQSTGFRTNLNSKYSFENLVISSNNDLAYAACSSVATSPGDNYNPLFIYGGVGLGKTHLLQATGNQIFQENPAFLVRYISMERFANELVGAIQNKKIKEFKNKYIDLDLLILDDIQFLAGKEKTQEEFFHIFESLYQHGKQIILSSDRPPKSIPTLEDRLRSRFEGGMIADVNKPNLETRVAIINKKLEEKNTTVNEDIINYLAEKIHHNVRELEGALNKIIVTSQLKNKETTLKEVIELTKDIISTSHQNELSPEKILSSVADFYSIKTDEISGRCRKKKVIKPRQVAIYLLRKDVKLSFPDIGETIGGRDHSTAIYAYEKIKKELEKNELLKDQLNFIREKFVDY